MSPRLSNLRILVVDDDDDIRESIALALVAEGASIMQARDGNEAIVMWRRYTPPVVVLDMMLPGRSGFLVLEELGAHAEPPLVIMVTANEGRRHEQYAHALGVHAYLTKPVALETLIETIASLQTNLPPVQDPNG